MSFHCFAQLPAELRHLIWKISLALYQDESEVCLCWPSNLSIGYGEDVFLSPDCLPKLPFTVDLPFPSAMHVCRESRAAVLARGSPFRFRDSSAAGCPVPFRLFRPDLDTLFIGSDALRALCCVTLSDLSANHPALALRRILRETENLAVSGPDDIRYDYVRSWISSCRDDNDPAQVFESNRGGCQGRKLWYVVAGSRYVAPMSEEEEEDEEEDEEEEEEEEDDDDEQEQEVKEYEVVAADVIQQFKQPGRRCKLVPLSGKALQRVRVAGDIGYLTTVEEDINQVCVLMVSVGFETDAVMNMPITPCTFVEYQKDGTWKEVCQDRIYEPDAPNAGPGPWASGPPVPMAERPDPEQVRPHDVDIPFAPWAVGEPVRRSRRIMEMRNR